MATKTKTKASLPSTKSEPTRLFPEKVRIAGLDFEVREVQEQPLGHSWVGEIDHTGQAISILVRGKPEQSKKTMLHELIHAADKMYGRHDLSEDQVLSLENGLWAIFKDNPSLLAAIFGD